MRKLPLPAKGEVWGTPLDDDHRVGRYTRRQAIYGPWSLVVILEVSVPKNGRDGDVRYLDQRGEIHSLPLDVVLTYLQKVEDNA
jgi:hypothetical protein